MSDFGYSFLQLGIGSADTSANLQGGNISRLSSGYAVIYDTQDNDAAVSMNTDKNRAEVVYINTIDYVNGIITSMSRGQLGTTARSFNEAGHSYKIFNSIHWTQFNTTQMVALTDASTIAVDASLGKEFSVTLGGNRLLGNPTGNPTDGQLFMIRVRQDNGGSRVLTYDTQYRFGSNVTSPTLTTTGNKTDYLLFVYNSIDTKWDCVDVSNGY